MRASYIWWSVWRDCGSKNVTLLFLFHLREEALVQGTWGELLHHINICNVDLCRHESSMVEEAKQSKHSVNWWWVWEQWIFGARRHLDWTREGPKYSFDFSCASAMREMMVTTWDNFLLQSTVILIYINVLSLPTRCYPVWFQDLSVSAQWWQFIQVSVSYNSKHRIIQCHFSIPTLNMIAR